jgi:allophanate hydrolase subunit 2
MDEVHFQQHGSRCPMWIPPEARDPVLLHHPTRKSVKYFGAVRIGDGRFVFRREQGSFDAATCHAFLRQLWTVTRRSDRRAVAAPPVVLRKSRRDPSVPLPMLTSPVMVRPELS